MLKRNDLIYPELSYKIVGCAYAVYNEIGPGHKEIIFQRALAIEFRKAGILFKEQLRSDILFHGEKIGTGFLDFLVEDKVVVEIKKSRFVPAAFAQVQQYLQSENLELGIIIGFASEKVIMRRVLNVNSQKLASTT